MGDLVRRAGVPRRLAEKVRRAGDKRNGLRAIGAHLLDELGAALIEVGFAHRDPGHLLAVRCSRGHGGHGGSDGLSRVGLRRQLAALQVGALGAVKHEVNPLNAVTPEILTAGQGDRNSAGAGGRLGRDQSELCQRTAGNL
jgi:hypothetical protein